MTNKKVKLYDSRLLVGFLIIAAGAILLLSKNSIGFNITFRTFWPVLIIILGLGMAFQYTDFRNFTSGGLIALIGTALLLDKLYVLPISQLWPVAIIIVGLMIIFRKPAVCRVHANKSGSSKMFCDENEEIKSDNLDINTVMGSGKYQFTSQSFKGGEVSSVMGSVEIDLRDAEIDGDSATIDASAVMSSIEIFLPSHWKAEVKGSPVLGSLDNRCHTPNATTKTVKISASAVMGSIDIRN